MFNVLIDELPSEYNGHPIDTSFRTGIMIMQALSDAELSEDERIFAALNLLFPERDGTFDIREALNGLDWYLKGWDNDNPDSSDKAEVKVMDFDKDQWRIYGAFRNQYNINLNIEELHFWEFMALLANLEECAFTRIVHVRSTDIKKDMSTEYKDYLRKAKERYAIETAAALSREEQARVDEFMKYATIRK